VDNFQLTLADAEIQKQKEALEELEAQKKFEDLKKEAETDIIEGSDNDCNLNIIIRGYHG